MDNNDQILDEFLLEAQEIFDQLDLDFVALEQNPDDKKLVGNIFRAMHTLKGSSGFFAFHRLEKVAHAGESLLSKIRDGALALNEEITDALLGTSDRLREIVANIQKQRVESAGDDTALIEWLKFLTDGGKDFPRPGKGGTSPPPQAAATVIEQPSKESTEPIVPSVSAQEPSPLPVADPIEIPEAKDGAEPERSTELAAPIKVSVELLDKLMNLVSEMVLARNRLLSFARTSGDLAFNNTVRRIDTVTLELQERMMKTRMQPISQVWTKFPRLVRDIAQDTGKKVDLIQNGAETELDRT
jgi:two-component system chemotaxis sensor kinase CheA